MGVGTSDFSDPLELWRRLLPHHTKCTDNWPCSGPMDLQPELGGTSVISVDLHVSCLFGIQEHRVGRLRVDCETEPEYVPDLVRAIGQSHGEELAVPAVVEPVGEDAA